MLSFIFSMATFLFTVLLIIFAAVFILGPVYLFFKEIILGFIEGYRQIKANASKSQ